MRVIEVIDQHGDMPGFFFCQAAGEQVGAVIQFFHRAQHALPHLGRYFFRIVKDV